MSNLSWNVVRDFFSDKEYWNKIYTFKPNGKSIQWINISFFNRDQIFFRYIWNYLRKKSFIYFTTQISQSIFQQKLQNTANWFDYQIAWNLIIVTNMLTTSVMSPDCLLSSKIIVEFKQNTERRIIINLIIINL